MKPLIVIILAAIFCVSAALAQKQTPINPASVYTQDGITFASPNQSGWLLLKSDKLETIFEKRDKDALSNASVKIIQTKTFETDEERLKSFEAMKKEDLSNLERDSLHFNYVRFKGSMCLEYDGIFKLDGASELKFKYFHIKGYLCPRSNAQDSAIQMEFSNYSNTRDFTEVFSSLSDEFFEKIAFPKASIKINRPRVKVKRRV